MDSELEDIKKYLYVETSIEAVFRESLKKIQPREIIFLCGSSGDGKSEILTRYSRSMVDKADFHLDATHSYDPTHTAIDTLNNLFTDQKRLGKPLVVGINVGMLANYEREGNDDHLDIKQAIKRFLGKKEQKGLFTFLDFEAFPKFKIENSEVSSEFFSELLDKVVRDDKNNNFRDYFNGALDDKRQEILVSNYLLLRDRGVRRAVVELLLNARIRQDQFITARMLLDFIYCIITGPSYLFDNLFSGGENELLESISIFDPSVIRDRNVDLFIMNHSLGIEGEGYKTFIDEVSTKFKVDGKLNALSVIRMFYLFRYSRLDNNYQNSLKSSFSDKGGVLYREIWGLHKYFNGDKEDKKKLRVFYDEVVFSAIGRYANRNAPYLARDEIFLSSHGSCDLASDIDLTVCYDDIAADSYADIHAFYIYLSVNDNKLEKFPINVNLLSLMLDVVGGYRPNKHDKNSVVLLDELVVQISKKMGGSEVLHLYKEGRRVRVKAKSDGEILVSGL